VERGLVTSVSGGALSPTFLRASSGVERGLVASVSGGALLPTFLRASGDLFTFPSSFSLDIMFVLTETELRVVTIVLKTTNSHTECSTTTCLGEK